MDGIPAVKVRQKKERTFLSALLLNIAEAY